MHMTMTVKSKSASIHCLYDKKYIFNFTNAD